LPENRQTGSGYSGRISIQLGFTLRISHENESFIIETSSMAMVLESPEGKVCLPSKDLARDHGFKKNSC